MDVNSEINDVTVASLFSKIDEDEWERLVAEAADFGSLGSGAAVRRLWARDVVRDAARVAPDPAGEGVALVPFESVEVSAASGCIERRVGLAAVRLDRLRAALRRECASVCVGRAFDAAFRMRYSAALIACAGDAEGISRARILAARLELGGRFSEKELASALAAVLWRCRDGPRELGRRSGGPEREHAPTSMGSRSLSVLARDFGLASPGDGFESEHRGRLVDHAEEADGAARADFEYRVLDVAYASSAAGRSMRVRGS